MGEWGLIVTFMVLGAGFEVVGLGLAYLEIRHQARQIRNFLKRPVTVYAHAAGMSVSAGNATVTGGREPVIEERVRLLEDAVKHLRDEVKQRDRKLAERWGNDINDAQERIEMALNDYKRETWKS